MIYLIQYDRSRAELVRLREFSADEKLHADRERLRVELELLNAKESQEVVLLEASNEKELRKTHRRYFETLDQLLEDYAVSSK